MKRLVWLIVCLMTITMTFSSCSKDDEQKEEESVNISGTWADENNQLFYYFWDGILDIKNAETGTLQMRYQYSVNGNDMFWSLPTIRKEKKTEIEKKRIKEIEEELKNARGSRREELIDRLNDEIGGNKEDDKVSFHIIIVKLTSTELFLQIPNVGIRKLYRRKESNF